MSRQRSRTPFFRKVRSEISERSWLRKVAIFCWALVVLVAGITILELAARKLLPIWHSELGYRHMQPYFMTGGYNDQFVEGINNYGDEPAPSAYGYVYEKGIFRYEFRNEVYSIADRGDFLFQDRVRLANQPKSDDVVRIFAIGASAAYGIGASSRANRWYAVLERTLSEDLERNVKIVPAAMPGYVSTQERLILELMVLPRNPDAVIIFDGWNDAVLPGLFGSRPGDPYDQGMLYTEFYSPLHGLKKWLAKQSHLYFFLFHRSVKKVLQERQAEIIANPEVLTKYAGSTAAVYANNIKHMLERCRDKEIPCFVFVQPSLDMTLRNNPPDDSPWEPDPITVTSYQKMLSNLRALDLEQEIHDLTSIFDAPGRMKWYIDPVHFNDSGHAAIAAEMHPIVLNALLN